MSVYLVLRASTNTHFQTEASQMQQMHYNFSFGDSSNCHFTIRPHVKKKKNTAIDLT